MNAVQRTSRAFKRPSNLLDCAESPIRNGADVDDGSALHSASHREFGKLSRKLNDDSGVFSGSGTPDKLDSVWLAINTKTQEREPRSDENSVESPQKDVSNLLVTVRFSLDPETIQQMVSNPDQETAINVRVKRRRAEVKVSTLSAEQKHEVVKCNRRGTRHICPLFCGGRCMTSRKHAVYIVENALGGDAQRRWSI